MKFSSGQLHGLLGENGAGKSTTANIISGEIIPNEGSIFIDGKEVSFKNPKDSIKKGIGYVHQRPMLAEDISIKENLLLGLKKNHWSKQDPFFEQTISTWLKSVNLKTLVKNTGSDTRFFVALTCALLKQPELLILDEPSALLDQNQRDFLYSKLQELAAKGMNIIIITHSLYEAHHYCNTIIKLEDGHICQNTETNTEVNIKMTDSSYKLPEKNIENQNIKTEKSFSINNVICRPKNQAAIFNISFQIKSGEITLIQGLPEDGLLTLENLITGFQANHEEKKYLSGTITFPNLLSVNLQKKNFTTQLLRKEIKTGIIPTDRKYRGSNPELTIEEITTFGQYGNKELALKIVEQAQIDISLEEKASNLSGGMLQRLILARELFFKPDLLILCHPLQGLDTKACSSICKKITEAASNGTMILILSSGDYPSQLSNHYYKLHDGNLEAIF